MTRQTTRRRNPSSSSERIRVVVAWACALLLTASLNLACGRKTPPRAPELVLPETVETLAAANGADGVLLTWKRPERYTGGGRMRDLGGFRIERAVEASPFTPLAELPVTDHDRFRQLKNFSYLDAQATPGQAYRYRLFSFTLDGYVSAPSSEAAIMRQAPEEQPEAQ